MDSIRQLGMDSVVFFANDVVIAITKTSRRINENILSWSDIPTDRQIPLGRYWDDTGEPWFFDSVRTGVNFGSDPPPEIGVPRSTDF